MPITFREVIFRTRASCGQKSSRRIERNYIQIAWSVGATKVNENRKKQIISTQLGNTGVKPRFFIVQIS